MSWEIEIGRDAKKELARLPPKMQTRISRAILALREDPFGRGSRKLMNRDGWRIRVGDYRVIYIADSKARRLAITAIGNRRDIYRG